MEITEKQIEKLTVIAEALLNMTKRIIEYKVVWCSGPSKDSYAERVRNMSVRLEHLINDICNVETPELTEKIHDE